MDEHILFPDEVIIMTEFFRVGQDWEVPIPGFFIIAPTREMTSVTDFTDEEAIEFIRLVRSIRQGMRDILGIQEVYLFQNEDTDGGFHLWMFPRLEWMDSMGRKIESVRPIMNYAKEHMIQESVFTEVRKYVADMKEYMSSFGNRST